MGACLLFAVSYSRLGVVRRHLTRSEFSSNVERSPQEARALAAKGDAIHIYWLEGYIFFGSSNRVFESVRATVDAQQDPPVAFVVLDCKGVAGFDTSALLSLLKLRNHVDGAGVTLVFAGLESAIAAALERTGVIDGQAAHGFASRNEALEWCEDELLHRHEVAAASEDDFGAWLRREMGGAVQCDLLAYFECLRVAAGTCVYAEGDSADSIEFVADGRVAVTITGDNGEPLRLKRMSGWTVIGEMGFFRGTPRAATVVVERPSVIYRLTRAEFERMRRDEPAVAFAFLHMIIRVLSDRMDTANREVAALV